jgi:hypothetical protein
MFVNMASAERPVIVTVSPKDAGEALFQLLDDEYGATADEQGDDQVAVSVTPVDNLRRGTVIYRVIQASRTVAERFPAAAMFLITENGDRWRLPPPAL